MQPQQPYQPQPPEQPYQPPQPYPPQPQAPPQFPQPQAPAPAPTQPSQPQFQQPQYSIDYLNHITPAPQKPKWQVPKLILPLLAGAVVLFIGIAVVAAMSGGSSNSLPTLAMKLRSLQTVTDGAQSKIKSNQLRVTNSNLSLYLTNANRDVATPLKNTGSDPTKVLPSAAVKASTDKLTATLEDARLNGIYDRVYARNMDYQLTTLLLQMDQLAKSTGSASTRDFLQKTSGNLKTARDQFAGYTDSTN